jgi:mannose-6-phosphate isomerase-like protein (cupin superfamily)
VKKLLSGKVEIRPLPIVNPEDASRRRETRARLLSPNGELAVLADGQMAIRHLGYVELRPGCPRGNHFHKLRREYFYVMSGEVEIYVEESNVHETEKAMLRAGDLAVIDPKVAHAYLPSSSGHAIEFAAEAFDPADVYRQVIDFARVSLF